VAFAIVKNSKVKKIPGRVLLLAFKRSKIKYKANAIPQLMQLTKEFHQKSLARNQDIDVYITELEAIQIKLEIHDHETTEQAMVLHILNNLTEQYDMEVKLMEHRIHLYKEERKGKEVSVKDIRLELNLWYERI
jgi:hypothetical protein